MQDNNENENENNIFESNWNEKVAEFEDMNLHKDLLRGIFGNGFEKPSTIQQLAIKPILKGKDVIAQAQSGSGKTATFAIGILQNIDKEDLKTQALVIAPTRELANQSYEVIKSLGIYLGVSVHLSIGGTDTKNDIKMLKQGVQIVIGTPGRVNDMISKEFLKTANLKMLVIDEADEMLSLGFIEQINEIIKSIPQDTQIVFVSATMPPEIIKMTSKILNDPIRILIKKEEITLEGIKQHYISCVNDESKFESLLNIFSKINITQCIIYCNTQTKTEKLAEKLTENEFMVSCIHGKMSQEIRTKIMKEFRECATRILIATDLLARGIDVQQVDIVINYELPIKQETYIHRIGRSGRHGRRGTAINLIAKNEVDQLLNIEQFYNTEIKELPKNIEEDIN